MLSFTSFAEEAANYPPTRFPDAGGWGKNIQRTMRLLATSTPEHPNTVRILFYGQSITEQAWSKLVADDLRQRFPHAHLIIENRALGGFASQMLVKTAETDLYPFQPDLLIFHVYGAHNSYEDIIRRTRERTTAEILMQTDHVTKQADFTEETDPSKLPPAGAHWDAFMNHNWLPYLAKKYQAELCDQRSLWKTYLKENNLEPRALLKDAVHLNPHGEWLMAECVKAYMRYDPNLGPSPAEQWVQTLEVGQDVKIQENRLQVAFEGNRVEIICRDGSTGTAEVRIDGKKPSTFPALYGFSRAVTHPPGKWPVKWPVVAPITSQAPLILEDWTLSVKRLDATNDKLLGFQLTGSKTGPDGQGRSDAPFISNSGRVVIRPEDWNATYVMRLGGIGDVPDQFEVKWSVQPHFVDAFNLAEAVGAPLPLASGLPNTPHTLEITGADLTGLAQVRIHRPSPGPGHE
jgi:hypothetical protein